MLLQGNIYAIASWTQRYCLPDSNLYIGRNPETLSRVTLASLGIVFQTDLVVLLNDNIAGGYYKQLNNQTTKQPDN